MAESAVRRRLLLVSAHYAPEQAGTSRYATQIAEHWAAGGDEVHVLTGLPHYPAWRLDPGYAGVRATTEQRGGVTVHRRSHSVPARQSAPRRALYEATLLRGALKAAPAAGRPDLVAAQMPSLAAGVAGARLAARHGVPFVPLVRNLLGARAVLAGAVERYVLRRAALVGVTHESLVAEVTALGVPADRVHLVPNWSLIPGPTRPREEMRALLGWRPGQTVLLHAGDAAGDAAAGAAGSHGPDVLVEAARLDPTLRVVLMGGGGRRERLRALAGGLPNLDFAPPADERELPDLLGAADVLAVTDGGVPPELASYFAARRPVVAAVPAGSGTAGEIARADAGAVVPPGDPSALLAAVRELAASAAEGRLYGALPPPRDAALSALTALLTSAVPPVTAAPAPPPHPPQTPPSRPSTAPDPAPARPSTAPESPAVPELVVPSRPSTAPESPAAPEPVPPVRPSTAPESPAVPELVVPTRPSTAPDPAPVRPAVPPRPVAIPSDVPPRPADPPAAPQPATASADDEPRRGAGNGAGDRPPGDGPATAESAPSGR